MKLGTIEQEAAACRARWAGSKVGDLAWYCHHQVPIEPLTEPAEVRIAYILAVKPKRERARRLHEFRPVKAELPGEVRAACAKWIAACAEWNAARAARAKWGAACTKWYAACARWGAACAKCGAACAKLGAELQAAHLLDVPDSRAECMAKW
jgi:hypothetical protein